jgi:hypothetical protein
VRGIRDNGEDNSVPDLKISIAQSLPNCCRLKRIPGLIRLGGGRSELIA